MTAASVDHVTIEGCRSCDSGDLEVVLDFGPMPLADGLVHAGSSRADEAVFPISLARCVSCTLVQIRETVDPGVLYSETYPYYSSFSDALLAHSARNVDDLVRRYGLGDTSRVVELASNDGYLLQWFQPHGVEVLGIDPAPGPAAAAVRRGVPTVCDFFDLDVARRVSEDVGRADLVIGNNVLAHVPDQNAFVAAIECLLAPGGTVVMEFPYVKDLIEHTEFDTIYHEHHCYFSVESARALFARHGLHLNRVEHLTIHGGSLRVHCGRTNRPEDSVGEMIETERRLGLDTSGPFEEFAARVQQVRRELRGLVEQLVADGSRVAAYAAAAKGAVLLNYCDIGPELIDYVVDRNTHKIGFEMPGKAIPIRSPEHLLDDPPDYLLVLAWNFKDEIMGQQSWFPDQGGRFIVPIPQPVIV